MNKKRGKRLENRKYWRRTLRGALTGWKGKEQKPDKPNRRKNHLFDHSGSWEKELREERDSKKRSKSIEKRGKKRGR